MPTGFVFDMQIAMAMAKGVSLSTPLKEIADKRVVDVAGEASPLEVVEKMVKEKLPVTFVRDKGKLVGGFCFMNAIAACASHDICPEFIERATAVESKKYAKLDKETLSAHSLVNPNTLFLK